MNVLTHDAAPAEIDAYRAIECLSRRERWSHPRGQRTNPPERNVLVAVNFAICGPFADQLTLCHVSALASRISGDSMNILFRAEAEPTTGTNWVDSLPLVEMLRPGSKVTVTIPKPGAEPLKLRSVVDSVCQAYEQIYQAGLLHEWNYSREQTATHRAPGTTGRVSRSCFSYYGGSL